MAKYLVVEFDRYDTEDSVHTYVSAKSHKEAIIRVCEAEDDDEGYLKSDLKESLIVKDDFASLAMEESDILSYKIPDFD